MTVCIPLAAFGWSVHCSPLLLSLSHRKTRDKQFKWLTVRKTRHRRHLPCDDVACSTNRRSKIVEYIKPIHFSVQFSCCQEEGDPVTMNVRADKFSPIAPYCDIFQELYWTHKSTLEQLTPQCYMVETSNSKLHAYYTAPVILKLLSCVPPPQYTKKHVHVRLDTANIKAYFHDTALRACFVGWHIWRFQTTETTTLCRPLISKLLYF